MREGSYHVEALALLKAQPGIQFNAKQLADKLGVDPKRASMNSVMRELMRKHTPHVHREKLNKPEQTRQFYYWFDDSKANECYEGQVEDRAPLDILSVDQKYLDAVDKVIGGLSGSDFVLQCGEAAIKEMREYRVDMACELQRALAA